MRTEVAIIISVVFILAGCGNSQEGISVSQAVPADPFTVDEAQIVRTRPIPKTLDEAHAELERIIRPSGLKEIDGMESEEEMLGFAVPIEMTGGNNWEMGGNSPLAKHMRQLGFTNAEDMHEVIFHTLWCKRHGKNFRLKERAEDYKTYWKENKWPAKEDVDPEDKSEVKWIRAFDAEGRPYRMIYIGKSKKTGRWLAFENPRGVYVPDKEFLELINESEGENWEDIRRHRAWLKKIEELELSVLAKDPQAEAYRFIYNPSLDRRSLILTLHFTKEGSCVLHVHRLNAKDDTELTGKIKIEERDAAAYRKLFANPDVFDPLRSISMEDRGGLMGLDGAWWKIETVRKGKYTFASVWSPTSYTSLLDKERDRYEKNLGFKIPPLEKFVNTCGYLLESAGLTLGP